MELRSPEWAVALRAEGLLLVAWWEFSEGGGEVELGWRLFWRCGGCFGVFGGNGVAGVCGGLGVMQEVLG